MALKRTTPQAVIATLKKAGLVKAHCGHKQSEHQDGFEVRQGQLMTRGFVTVEPGLYASKSDNETYIEVSKTYERILQEAGFYVDRKCPPPAMLRVAKYS